MFIAYLISWYILCIWPFLIMSECRVVSLLVVVVTSRVVVVDDQNQISHFTKPSYSLLQESILPRNSFDIFCFLYYMPSFSLENCKVKHSLSFSFHKNYRQRLLRLVINFKTHKKYKRTKYQWISIISNTKVTFFLS